MLSKSEFIKMVDDFMDSAPEVFRADGWSVLKSFMYILYIFHSK